MTVVIKSRLGLIAEEAIPKASAAVRKTAFDIEEGAKARSRVDTGAMRSSWQTEVQGSLEARISAGVEYAIYNEYGTSRMSAQPMARPAAHQAEAPFLAAMKQVFS
jgi:HK97 gp10 family phage protein